MLHFLYLINNQGLEPSMQYTSGTKVLVSPSVYMRFTYNANAHNNNNHATTYF